MAAHPRGERTRLTVYVDGFCPRCRRAARLLKALDLFGRLEVRSFRHDRTYAGFGLTEAALERAMQVVVRGRSGWAVYGGFAGVRALSSHLPALWPLWPLAWVLDVTGWGARIYRWLAERRAVLPDPQACAGAVRGRCRRGPGAPRPGALGPGVPLTPDDGA